MARINQQNNSSDPRWGQKPYLFNPPLVNDRVSKITRLSNMASYGGLIHANNRPYVPENPYPNGTPINPTAARSAGTTFTARPYVMAFESWINNAKRAFGVFMPEQRGGEGR